MQTAKNKVIEKLLKALDEEMNEYVENGQLPYLIRKFTAWRKTARHGLSRLFYLIEGSEITYDECKAILTDFEAPTNELEKHIICRLLDYNKSKEIPREWVLRRDLWDAAEALWSEDEFNPPNKFFTTVQDKHQTKIRFIYTQGMPYLQPKSKPLFVICIAIFLIEPEKRDPTKVPKTSLKVAHMFAITDKLEKLAQVISRTLVLPKVNLYRDQRVPVSEPLSQSLTFTDIGCIGDVRETPEEITIYFREASSLNHQSFETT